jgi:hypothetical protein
MGLTDPRNTRMHTRTQVGVFLADPLNPLVVMDPSLRLGQVWR